jgi:hypothetical protein
MDLMVRVGLHRPDWGLGGEPAVKHRLGLSALASMRGPGLHILLLFKPKSPAGWILSIGDLFKRDAVRVIDRETVLRVLPCLHTFRINITNPLQGIQLLPNPPASVCRCRKSEKTTPAFMVPSAVYRWRWRTR